MKLAALDALAALHETPAEQRLKQQVCRLADLGLWSTVEQRKLHRRFSRQG